MFFERFAFAITSVMKIEVRIIRSESGFDAHRLVTFIYYKYIKGLAGQVDQLEDRYLGMVEAASSNLALSTIFTLARRPENGP